MLISNPCSDRPNNLFARWAVDDPPTDQETNVTDGILEGSDEQWPGTSFSAEAYDHADIDETILETTCESPSQFLYDEDLLMGDIYGARDSSGSSIIDGHNDQTIADKNVLEIDEGLAWDRGTNYPSVDKEIEDLDASAGEGQLEYSPPPAETLSGSLAVVLPQSTLITPRSFYHPFEPGIPLVSERTAVQQLIHDARADCRPGDDFLELTLDDFAVYSDYPMYGVEMRPLTQLDTANRGARFFFDGVLRSSKRQFFVREVPISALPIGNYGDPDEPSVRGAIWIPSTFSRSGSLYYRLGRPAKEYLRFYEPFIWVADLAKHFVEYVDSMGDMGKSVSIHNFQSHFKQRLVKTWGQTTAVANWLSQHPSDDFRMSVVANLDFLHKEAVGVLGPKSVNKHAIWAETMDFTRYKEIRVGSENNELPPTIVTPYIMECFRNMPFADRLKATPFSPLTQALRNSLIRRRKLESSHPVDNGVKSLSTAEQERIKDIKPGDTISTHRDAEGTGTKWEREEVRDFNDIDRWFALVQRVHVSKDGLRSFDVTWYYRPADTLCGLMKYPWNNELFLSDHCSCTEPSKIREEEVLGVHRVQFGGASTTEEELFCRQLYLHGEAAWISLEPQHMVCEHLRESEEKLPYTPGETVLAHLDKRGDVLEPCEIVSWSASPPEETRRQPTLTLRRLLRRHQVDPDCADAPPNELVYSEMIETVRSNSVHDRCHVRFFDHCQRIPTPYDRAGVGAFFYMTHEQKTAPDGGSIITPLKKCPDTMRQGFDPGRKIPKLRGLDLFCGGGNFGRGLEESGAIGMRWANDYDSKAIHTYMANVDPAGEKVHPFLGSIDTLQHLALAGDFSPSVPRPGEVDFISAGSPCPGFSRLTNDKTTVKQRKNQSLVAAFASSVDLYRPRYALLENVPSIVQNKAKRSQDVLSQLLCSMVGLGYQAQFYLLDASSCGAPQRRSRVFLTLAAPGHKLPRRPLQTHSHPPRTMAASVGKLPTGEPMALRYMAEATPFPFITGRQATADLPPIHDGKPAICVSHPDHRIAFGHTRRLRVAARLIPTHPHGMNFSKAWFGRDGKPGVLTDAERACFPSRRGGATSSVNPTARNSSAYGRQYPDGLLETITTRPGPGDAKFGRQFHWSEDRVMTIMEARRAQGFRDTEVLLGSAPDQYRIVGNSVSRQVSIALGAVIREAWVATLEENGGCAPGAVDAKRPGHEEDEDVRPSKAVKTGSSVDSPVRTTTAASTQSIMEHGT